MGFISLWLNEVVPLRVHLRVRVRKYKGVDGLIIAVLLFLYPCVARCGSSVIFNFLYRGSKTSNTAELNNENAERGACGLCEAGAMSGVNVCDCGLPIWRDCVVVLELDLSY